MSYKADTIKNVVSKVNQEYFLPTIQREFVWGPDQVCQLFDSLMRRYPIGTFLFWDVAPENRDKLSIYNFIDRAREQGENHNESAQLHGVPKVTLVLDGQQRLTSLYIGLKGTFKIKRKHKHRNNPDAWVERRLYLDLLSDPDQPDGGDDSGMRYSFEFRDKGPALESPHYWYEVGRILDYSSEDLFDEARQEEAERLPSSVTATGKQRVFDRNLKRLYDVIWSRDNVSYHNEEEQDDNRVLDIFVRTNSGGTKLSKSDLLLSMISAEDWGGSNARDEIHDFVDDLNHNLSRRNDLSKDFVMKSCLVLADLSVRYRLENFNRENLAIIGNEWLAVKKYVRAGVELANRFGIDEDTLTSANALIPIIYYMKTRNILLDGTSRDEVESAQSARRWLIGCLLNRTFGGQGDNLLTDMREVLKAEAGTFPAGQLHDVARKHRRTSTIDEDTIESMLELEYSDRDTFLALSLLYDEQNWGTVRPEQDHIFPQALFKPDRMDEAGISGARQLEFSQLRDKVGNLELLIGRENAGKQDRNFAEWLRTRSPEFRRRHLIPENDDLLKLDRFDEFVEEREKLIRARLKQVLQA
ncbi:MAG: DUF262 domain-containing protein [Thermoplasmata archaeon]